MSKITSNLKFNYAEIHEEVRKDMDKQKYNQ